RLTVVVVRDRHHPARRRRDARGWRMVPPPQGRLDQPTNRSLTPGVMWAAGKRLGSRTRSARGTRGERMPMPTDIGVVDLMIGFTTGRAPSHYGSLNYQLSAADSRTMAVPAGNRS